MGAASAYHPSPMDRIDAGLVEGFLRAGTAARFCHVDVGQGQLDKVTNRTDCAGGGDNGHAGLDLPLVFRGAWSEEPDTEIFHWSGSRPVGQPWLEWSKQLMTASDAGGSIACVRWVDRRLDPPWCEPGCPAGSCDYRQLGRAPSASEAVSQVPVRTRIRCWALASPLVRRKRKPDFLDRLIKVNARPHRRWDRPGDAQGGPPCPIERFWFISTTRAASGSTATHSCLASIYRSKSKMAASHVPRRLRAGAGLIAP